MVNDLVDGLGVVRCFVYVSIVCGYFIVYVCY